MKTSSANSLLSAKSSTCARHAVNYVKRQIMKLFLAVLFLSLQLAGQAQEPPATRELRVVSLSPRITETIFMLGKGNCLVGRSSACDYPAEAKKLPVVGNFGGPFLEHLATVKPDYVITNKLKDQASKRAIESLGARVIVLEDYCFDDYIKCVKTLGTILNCQKNAEAEANRFTQALKNFKIEADKIPIASRPKVYIEIWHRPMLTCGKKTFINEMVEYAGGINIGQDENVESFPCSFEWVLQKNPNVIICPGMGSGKSGEIAARNGWEQISAVKNQRVYTDLEQDKLYRLGPRTIDGIALLRKYIYATTQDSVKK